MLAEASFTNIPFTLRAKAPGRGFGTFPLNSVAPCGSTTVVPAFRERSIISPLKPALIRTPPKALLVNPRSLGFFTFVALGDPGKAEGQQAGACFYGCCFSELRLWRALGAQGADLWSFRRLGASGHASVGWTCLVLLCRGNSSPLNPRPPLLAGSRSTSGKFSSGGLNSKLRALGSLMFFVLGRS